eukprot:COSAG01_NODE_29763_length_630_cov_0.954802_1_plen_126_part_00
MFLSLIYLSGVAAGMVSFAMTCIRARDSSSERAQDAVLSVSTSGLAAIYWNGRRLARDTLATGVYVDEVTTTVVLRANAGWNSILIKSSFNEQPGTAVWAILAAVYRADGVTALDVEVDMNCSSV